MSTLPTSIEIGGKKHPLLPPTGFRRIDFLQSFPGNEAPPPLRARWGFGALGLVWGGKRTWPELKDCGYDVLVLGEHVLTGLEAAGLDPQPLAIYNAMVHLLNALVPSVEEVAAAKDFSGGPSAET